MGGEFSKRDFAVFFKGNNEGMLCVFKYAREKAICGDDFAKM
jgi:hypothetical protein